MRRGDRVIYNGRKATVITDHCNGLFTLAYDYQGQPPKIDEGPSYVCGGTERSIHPSEVQLIHE